MALEYMVENLEALELDPTVKALYTEKEVGDKKMYVLSVNGVTPDSDIEVLKKTLKKERELREGFEKTVKSFGEHTPEGISALMDELNTLKAAKASASEEDFLKRLNESKDAFAKELQSVNNKWEAKEQEYLGTIKSREQDLLNMRLENKFNSLFNEKGDPSGRSLGFQKARAELEWNEDRQDFFTKDGLISIKDWMDTALYKEHPCLLKPSLSAAARGGDSTTVSYNKYFDPSSPEYSDDPSSVAYAKRIELFRTKPDMARALMAKYKK